MRGCESLRGLKIDMPGWRNWLYAHDLRSCSPKECGFDSHPRHMQTPYGETIPPPDFLVPPENWPEYGTVAMPETICSREEVNAGIFGIRWGLWPFFFEEYIGQKEPDLSKTTGRLGYVRTALWKRLHDGPVPKGWWAPRRTPWRIDAFYRLHPGYVEDWQKNPRREVRVWNESVAEGRFRIEEIPFEEFKAAYNTSTVARKIGSELCRVLERKLAMPACAPHIVLWGARDLTTGRIIAGTAAIFSPTHKASIRECPFMLAEARGTFAPTGLIDHWYQEALRRDTQVVQFANFYQKGEPKSWKGFSEFKSHFGATLVHYPPTLVRFVPGKIF